MRCLRLPIFAVLASLALAVTPAGAATKAPVLPFLKLVRARVAPLDPAARLAWLRAFEANLATKRWAMPEVTDFAESEAHALLTQFGSRLIDKLSASERDAALAELVEVLQAEQKGVTGAQARSNRVEKEQSVVHLSNVRQRPAPKAIWFDYDVKRGRHILIRRLSDPRITTRQSVNSQIRVENAAGKPIRVIPVAEEVDSALYLAEQGALVTLKSRSGANFNAGDMQTLEVWDLASAKPRLSLQVSGSSRTLVYDARTARVFFANGSMLSSVALSGSDAKAWRVEAPASLPLESDRPTLAGAGDGRLMEVSPNGRIRTLDVTSIDPAEWRGSPLASGFRTGFSWTPSLYRVPGRRAWILDTSLGVRGGIPKLIYEGRESEPPIELSGLVPIRLEGLLQISPDFLVAITEKSLAVLIDIHEADPTLWRVVRTWPLNLNVNHSWFSLRWDAEAGVLRALSGDQPKGMAITTLDLRMMGRDGELDVATGL